MKREGRGGVNKIMSKCEQKNIYQVDLRECKEEATRPKRHGHDAAEKTKYV